MEKKKGIAAGGILGIFWAFGYRSSNKRNIEP
jgi:hypothetical protein